MDNKDFVQISLFDLVIFNGLPPIGSTIYCVTANKVIDCIVSRYSIDGCHKYLHGVDSNGTRFYQHVGAVGNGLFFNKSDAVNYLKSFWA